MESVACQWIFKGIAQGKTNKTGDEAQININDDVQTQEKWWSRLYIKLFWSGVDDTEIAKGCM